VVFALIAKEVAGAVVALFSHPLSFWYHHWHFLVHRQLFSVSLHVVIREEFYVLNHLSTLHDDVSLMARQVFFQQKLPHPLLPRKRKFHLEGIPVEFSVHYRIQILPVPKVGVGSKKFLERVNHPFYLDMDSQN